MGSRKTLAILSLVAFVFVGVFTTAFALLQAEKYVASRARKELAALKPTLDVSFDHAKINPFTRMVMLKGVEVRSSTFEGVLSIRAVGAGRVDWDSIIAMAKTRKPVVPRQIFFAVSGLSIPSAWAGATASETLKSLGYETLDVSATLGLTIDPSTKGFAISPLAVDIEKAGRIEFSVSFANTILPSKADVDLLKKNPKAFVVERLPAYGDVALESISLRYDDDSFVEKATELLVAQGEDHPVALLNLALEQPEATRQTASVKAGSFSRQGLVALRDFLQTPGTISISSALSQPVPFTSLLDERAGGSIDQIAEKLALRIEKN
ncbi:MAG: hypothetical protein V4760_01475 [Bdellovibrionota bacterium]